MMRYLLILSVLLFLPNCKASNAAYTQNFDVYIEVAKAFTKANIKRLFPDAQLENHLVDVKGTFSQADLRKIFNERARRFLTPEGRIATETMEFSAVISWKRTEDIVVIYLRYEKKGNIQDKTDIKPDSL